MESFVFSTAQCAPGGALEGALGKQIAVQDEKPLTNGDSFVPKNASPKPKRAYLHGSSPNRDLLARFTIILTISANMFVVGHKSKK